MTDLFDADDEVESVLFVQREISVYRVPPLTSMDGYKAADWGLDQPLWKGRLRILEKESSGVIIVLEDGQTGTTFARAPYTDEGAVQPSLDSSRYFVLRVQDPTTGNKAHIGIGFTDRTESLDFKIALQDYEKRKNAPAKAEKEKEAVASGPKVDYSLKEGQTFKISIPGGRFASSSTSKPETASSSTAGSGSIPLLPPPPSVRKK
ncbi:hypothetical protein M408DRAFT_329961 [Serendipita vermifera MAFF 305830]|uniref:NECAP PHear domain-containing protein n=1 Tax=Serendipita vermifera MAFF 305830 TaxID=933852 RepID=A0A0C2XEG9_SERVB|nr:hypothetical protein M408DRAFT_329961 [Serendipita vermifera MAFF 305830]